MMQQLVGNVRQEALLVLPVSPCLLEIYILDLELATVSHIVD